MNKTNSYLTLILVALVSLSTIIPVLAQSEEDMVLKLTRNFGYSSGTGDIQGRFTAIATGPDNLDRVEFLIDKQVVAQAEQPPFEFKFHTDEYSLGVHTLQAIGYTTDGDVLTSNQQRLAFVSSNQVWKTVGSIFLVIFAVIAVGVLLSTVIPALAGRGKPVDTPLGVPRNYGLLGGGICPKCNRPFSVHIWSLNVLIGKLDRCPHCGKWSIIQRAPIQVLRAAEEAELERHPAQSAAPVPSEEDQLRKQLDDSRYQDL